MAIAELAGRGVAQVLISDDAGAGSLAVQGGYDVVPAGTDTPQLLAERAVTLLLGRLRS